MAAAFAGAVLALAAVTSAWGTSAPPLTAAGQAREVPLGLDLYMPVPEGNPLTPARIALGRKLFFDPRLSVDRTKACASCHDPERAFTDGKRVAEGVGGRTGARNTPTLVNRGYGARHFLDGRARSLEDQVLLPIEGETELAYEIELAVSRLHADEDYRSEFRRAFGRSPDAEAVAQALASYVRTILSGNSPLDRFRTGDRDALGPEAREGLRIFLGRGNCTACHVGPNFTDEEFHNTGVAWLGSAGREPGSPHDAGRFVVTGKEEDLGAFKTPTLREIARTAPYMHDGSLARLDEVIDFYDRGGNPNPHLDPAIRPLGLTIEQKRALVAFLEALSGTISEGT